MNIKEHNEVDVDTYMFTFGKYRGQMYSDVVMIDPHYIQWCHSMIDHFNLPEDEIAYVDSRVDDAENWQDPLDYLAE